MTIDRSVATIAPPGVHAAISATAGHAVTIDAPGHRIVLRGLYLDGQGGQNGIFATEFGALHVENCGNDGDGRSRPSWR